jgi:hypothetical protein
VALNEEVENERDVVSAVADHKRTASSAEAVLPDHACPVTDARRKFSGDERRRRRGETCCGKQRSPALDEP